MLSLGLFSCENEDTGYSKGHGEVYLQLKTDTTLAVSPTTKAVDEFDQFKNVNNYSVEISQGEKVVASYEKFSEVPSSVELEAGTYQLKAFLGELVPAKFEAPYFVGSKKFLVEANKKTSASVTCALGNTRVSVSYSEDFKEAYPDYSLSMTTAHASEALVFKKDETRPAYFQADSTGQKLNLSMSLTSLENKKTTFTPSAITIKPREDVKLLFKTDGEAVSGVKLEITIDGATSDTTVNVGIPDYMLPLEAPLITPRNFVSGREYALAKGDDQGIWNKNKLLDIDIFAPGFIDSCIMTVNSSGLGLLKNRYDFANLSKEDEEELSKVGFKWNSSLRKQQSVKDAVNLNNIIEKLLRLNLNTIHEFSFVVKDSLLRQSSKEIVLKIKRGKPTLSINMEPGDVWAKHATLKAAVVDGNPETVCFYWKNNGSWRPLRAENYIYTVEGETCLMNLVGLTPDTQYEVCAFYGFLNAEFKSENYTFTTEKDLQLPNSSFEKWQKKIVYPSLIEDNLVYVPEFSGWYPYSASDKESWRSTNEQTIFSQGLIFDREKQSYLLYPSVEKVDQVSEGQAAAMISTIGWGKPTRTDGEIGAIDCEYITPGKLYLGASKDTETVFAFNARPLKLSFDYRYKSLSNESFKVRFVISSGDTEIGYAESVSGKNVNKYTKLVLPIVYPEQFHGMKATSLYLEFLSSTSGSSAKVERVQISTDLAFLWPFYKFVGSSLYIDNINLEY